MIEIPCFTIVFIKSFSNSNVHFYFYRDDLLTKLSQESASLRKMIGLPLSVYFDAFRTEDYETGGEEYLTFTDCHTNLGKKKTYPRKIVSVHAKILAG